jgi:diguanylate cyclase (GGDEF)-like protein
LQLDSFTILAACCSLLVLLGGLFVFLWFRDRSSTWLLWWGLPFIVNGVALTLYLRAGWQSDFMSIAFGNASRIFGLGCLWYGVRIFQGRRPPWGVITGISLLWIALCFFYPPFIEDMAARIAVISLLNTMICGFAVLELWRDRGDRLRSRLPMLGVFASYGVMMLGRAIFAKVAPFPIGAGPLDSTWLGIFSWVVVGHALFAAVLFLAMTLERREAEQRSFAMSDPLTGLLNRRAFGDFAQRMSRRRAGLRDAMAILVLDLDHFKSVNDQFGHEAGDRMLKAFAEVAEDSVRPSDQLFRMGGEEFCFVLPSTSLDDAIGVAERVRRSFEARQIETSQGIAATTVSIGIAATHFAVDIEVLLAAADAAVYEAKARGRNRVVVSEPATLLKSEAAAIPIRRRA